MSRGLLSLVLVCAACSEVPTAPAPAPVPTPPPRAAVAPRALPELPPLPPVAAPPAPVVAPPERITVRHGETFTLLAHFGGIAPLALAEANGLKPDSPLALGATLALPPGTSAAFEARRAAFEEKRLAAFLARRGGLARVTEHQVRKGETLTLLASRRRLPLWVVLHYNPDRDLDRLAVGDVVRLPEVGPDT